MTGQNQHKWGWMGFDHEGNEYAYCELCSGWQRNGERIDRISLPLVTYHSPDPTDWRKVWEEWPMRGVGNG